MRYIISRTSSMFSDDPPCNECEKITLARYKDFRTFKSIDEWKKRFPSDFEVPVYETGQENDLVYRVIDGSHISFWVKEIDSLPDFVSEYGDIVLSKDDSKHYCGYEDLFCLEIYDTYRE